MKHRERTYRNNIARNDLKTYQVSVEETDLFISSKSERSRNVAVESIKKHRNTIEKYIKFHPEFLTSLVPLLTYDEIAPPIVKEMIGASGAAGVGPMAAVAGAISEYVGWDIIHGDRNKVIIVENGGDIFINTPDRIITVGIFAGDSPLSHQIALKINPEESPLGICTSSSTVGHSLSFGKADAVCVKSKSTSLADAAATAICNLVKGERDIKRSLDIGLKITGVLGVVIIVGGKIGAVGDIEFV